MPVSPSPITPTRKSFAVAKKSIRFAGYGLVLASIALTGAGFWGASKFRHALPVYNGEANIGGLSGEVHVVRDTYGVPHIFAPTMNDAARALGYVHAGERMFQMEMQRRAGQGRLSEVVGSDTLGIDKFIRTLGLYHLAESGYAAMDPDAKAYFQAYADGVNAWITAHPDNLPPEFALMGFTPEPWKPADSVVWGKLMGLQLSHNYKLELLRANLAKTLSPEMLRTLFLEPISGDPITVAPHSKLAIKSGGDKTAPTQPPAGAPETNKPAHDKSGWLNLLGIDKAPITLGSLLGMERGASKEWVIAGSRTQSGKPILANDPHLDLEAPILWYLARIVTPNFWLKGATVPGIPIVLLGQNDHIAWGFTTTNSDTQDLFIETVDPKNDANYLSPQGSTPFVTRKEVIHVKHGLDATLDVRATRHGPVMSDIDKDMAKLAGDGKVMALSFTGLGENDRTSEGVMRLNRAHDWASFTDALKLYEAPTQNVVYADTAGHIGFINPGLVPVRVTGDGTVPVDGSSGKYDWRGTVPFTYIPHVYDPKAGFVFNANSTVTTTAFAPYEFSHDWDEPYRSRRLQYFFDTTAVHTLDTTAAMQSDIISTAATELMPYLLRANPQGEQAQKALALLKAWNGAMDKTRAEPLIFETWMYMLHKNIVAAKSGISLEEKGPYSAGSLAAILNANDAAWCGKDGCDAASRTAFTDALDFISSRYGKDMNKWRWGDEHISVLHNKVFGHIPYLSKLSDLSVASNGGYYTLDRGESTDVDAEHPFLRRHAGGFRGDYDLGDANQSRFMIATGQSGNILSPHYGDLVKPWNEGKYITLKGTHDELAAQGLPELVLKPSH